MNRQVRDRGTGMRLTESYHVIVHVTQTVDVRESLSRNFVTDSMLNLIAKEFGKYGHHLAGWW